MPIEKNTEMESQNLHFSFIIPTRNEEKLLPGCLEQFTPDLKEIFDLEIIVSDGGSNDSTIIIAKKFTDKIITHQNSSHRQTIAEGRNKGAELASGDILVFLNGDTRIPNIAGFFAQINSLMSDLSVVALAVKVQVMPDERIFSDKVFHAFFNQYVRGVNFLGIAMGRGECQIVRRSAFHAVGGYNNSLAAGEDFDLYNRLRSFGKIKYDPELLVYESPRRYRKYGYVKVYLDWVKNGFSVLFRKRSSSKIWEEVR
jgi:glycosyltransferase involved in cell wall biosynthesis